MSARSKQRDLLSTSLVFHKLTDQRQQKGVYQIIDEVSSGKITKVNEQLHKLIEADETAELQRLLSSADSEGKTPLFYACYYDFSNLVLLLLMKGSDSTTAATNGQTIFHLCTFLGRLECLQMIVNYERQVDKMKLLADVKQEMKNLKFKRSDILKGQLITQDKNNQTVEDKFTTFRQAIYVFFKSFLNQLLERLRQYIATIDEVQRNPLHYASLNKYTKCHQAARYLLDFGIEPNNFSIFESLFNEVSLLEPNKDLRIDPRQQQQAVQLVENLLLPLEYSKLVREFKYSVKLIVRQALNAQDGDGYSPLHLASFYGDFASVQYFLTLGADPKLIDNKNRKEVLDYASNNSVRKYLVDLKDATLKGDDKSFNFLVNCGQEVDEKKTIFGIAPIHNAIKCVSQTKDDTILRSVVKCNADINIPDSNGWTSLHYAVKNGDLSTVQYLIEQKAALDRHSSKGYQPIHVAAIYNQHKIITYLLQCRANIEALTVLKMTPLHLAAKKGNLESIKVLLDNNANIYAVDQRKWTALHFATFCYHKEAVQLLQRYDADFEKLKYMKNTQGKTAKQIITNEETQFALHTLWNAAREGNLDVVRRLVILGQDINEQTFQFEYTPLILAAQNQHYLVVKYLIEAQADIGITDKAKKTALKYAQETGNRKIMMLLDPSVR